MSHFTQVRVDLRDETLLVQALRALFGDRAVEVHRDCVPIQGYYRHERRMAHIVVRRSAAAAHAGIDLYSDLGFVRQEDGVYRAILDEMNQAVLDRIRQRYAVESAKAQAAAEGWIIGGEEIDPDGTIRLIVQPAGAPHARVTVSADQTGEAAVHVQGIAGMACLPLTHGLIASMGQVIEGRMTDEAFLSDDDAGVAAPARVRA